MIETNIIYNENCLTGLKKLPDNCIDCCVTSPPYFGLRDYGTATWEGGDSDCKHSFKVNSPYNENFNERCGNSPGQKKQESQRHEKLYKDVCKDCGAKRVDEQIGLETTPDEYVSTMVLLFQEVMRVLKPTGTLWLNIGDSYNGSGGNHKPHHKNDTGFQGNIGAEKYLGKGNMISTLKPKDLIGIPWMLAFALRSAGWYLRQDIIWNKPNPMPESVTDRCTKAHEYIFLLSKSKKYYFDADSIKTPIKGSSVQRLSQDINSQTGSFRVPGKTNGAMKAVMKGYEHRGSGDKKLTGHRGNYDLQGNLIGNGMANKRSVWTVTTKPFKEAHFATFPEDLIIDCIKAGCVEGGIVLDPFMGAGTTAIVSKKLNRSYVGFELNAEYLQIANKRINGPVEPEYIPQENSELSPQFVQYDLFRNPVR